MLTLFRRAPFILLSPDEPPAGGAPAGGQPPATPPTPELGAQPPAQAPTTPPAGGQPPATPPAGGQPPATPPAGGQPPATPPADWKPPTYEEWQARESAVAAANRRATELERTQQEAATAAATEQGRFKELYETEKTGSDTLKAGLVKAGVSTAVGEAAARLGFRNPALASRLIDLTGVNGEVQVIDGEAKVTLAADAGSLIEQRLNAALQADPYLKGTGGQQTQLPGAGGGEPAATGAAGMNAAIRQAAGR